MNKTKLDWQAVHELHQQGQLDEAKQGYLALLKKDSKNAAILHALSILCAQQDNLVEAISYLQKAIQLEPRNLTFKLHLSNFYKAQGLFNEASQLLHELIEHDPQFVPALNNLGSINYALGKFSDAVNFYQKALEKQPEFVDAYYNLGLAQNKIGDLKAAELAFEKLLSLSPDHFPARFHLACILMQQEKISDAEKQFLIIEEKHPFHFETQTNLATCFLKQGALNEAKKHYLNALELSPQDTQILFNLGVINTEQGFMDSAIQYYQRTIQIDPDFFAAHNNLGVAFIAKQHVGYALHHFQEALRLQPQNEAIQYTIEALSKNQRLLAAPSDYITALFDAYADHYDAHLIQALDYQVPKLLHDALKASNKIPPEKWDILDLGCGTGLCGQIFKPLAKTLTGVDLSKKMLEIAAQKQIYDELAAEHLHSFLEKKLHAYDLILAGDVLVYVGDLDNIFHNVYKALRKNSLFAFNVEVSDQAEFNMNQSGRFAHQKTYIEKLADKHQFKIVFYKQLVTRTQNNEPVQGHVYVLQSL